jgi:hypothetical protein
VNGGQSSGIQNQCKYAPLSLSLYLSLSLSLCHSSQKHRAGQRIAVATYQGRKRTLQRLKRPGQQLDLWAQSLDQRLDLNICSTARRAVVGNRSEVYGGVASQLELVSSAESKHGEERVARTASP